MIKRLLNAIKIARVALRAQWRNPDAEVHVTWQSGKRVRVRQRAPVAGPVDWYDVASRMAPAQWVANDDQEITLQ